MNRRIRVLVVDDSAFARKVLRQVLSTSAELEVVGVARDGLEALEKIAELSPDVVTLDLVMPNLDGVGVLNGLPREGAPRVIVVSTSDGDSALGVAALQAGAVDIVRKPTALATEQLYELAAEVVQKVKAAALARSPQTRPPSLPPVRPSLWTATRQIVVIGASTGGPQALTSLLAALPADLPVPLVIALHIPAGYTRSLSERLNDTCAIEVREAEEGLVLRPGLAVVARGGAHVEVYKRGDAAHVTIDTRAGIAVHAPSVDILFRSTAQHFGAAALGVVLTGMGDDGTIGASLIHQAGGIVLTEAEGSCVVYGMPRCVKEAGHSEAEVLLEDMASAIVARL